MRWLRFAISPSAALAVSVESRLFRNSKPKLSENGRSALNNMERNAPKQSEEKSDGLEEQGRKR